MVFDIKMEDFRSKARLAAGGNTTKAPATIVYAIAVSREIVRIVLMIAALNDLGVNLGNILNSYVQAPVTKKIWTTLGHEFGIDAGRTAVIVGGLYGQKSGGAALKKYLTMCIESFGYETCKFGLNL